MGCLVSVELGFISCHRIHKHHPLVSFRSTFFASQVASACSFSLMVYYPCVTSSSAPIITRNSLSSSILISSTSSPVSDATLPRHSYGRWFHFGSHIIFHSLHRMPHEHIPFFCKYIFYGHPRITHLCLFSLNIRTSSVSSWVCRIC